MRQRLLELEGERLAATMAGASLPVMATDGEGEDEQVRGGGRGEGGEGNRGGKQCGGVGVGWGGCGIGCQAPPR